MIVDVLRLFYYDIILLFENIYKSLLIHRTQLKLPDTKLSIYIDNSALSMKRNAKNIDLSTVLSNLIMYLIIKSYLSLQLNQTKT